MCVICNRCLYKKSVKIFYGGDYKIDMEGLVFQINKENYICHACHKTLKKGSIPLQGVSNNLKILFVTKTLSNLNMLERVLISLRILFKEIAIMPKG